MAERKPRVRTGRRVRARAHEALVRDLEALDQSRPGGAPGRPIDVESAAQVEPLASQGGCPLCEGLLVLIEHAAETHDGSRLRVAHLRCSQCGVPRIRYFRLRPAVLN